jgi:hypothetical protein
MIILLVVTSFFSVFAGEICPVQAATGTFGHTELGTTIGLNGYGGVYVSAFQAPVEADKGIMTEVVCAVKTVEGSGYMMPVVYAADGPANNYSSTDPSTLLSTGSPIAINETIEWKHMPLSKPVTIQSGQLYYLGYFADVGTYPSQDYRNPPSTPTSIFEMELAGGWGSYPNPPSPFGNVTYVHAGVNVLAAYAVYTVAVSPNNKTQYEVTFVASGLGSDATGENATANSSSQCVEDGASLPFSFAEVISSSANGKRYVLSSVNATSPLIVTATTTVNAFYTAQFQVSFVIDPVGGGTITPPVGTEVWADVGNLALSAIPKTGYAFLSWYATGDITFTSSTSNNATAIVEGAGTITASFTAVPGLTVPLTLVFAFFAVIIAVLVLLVIIFRHYKHKPHSLS